MHIQRFVESGTSWVQMWSKRFAILGLFLGIVGCWHDRPSPSPTPAAQRTRQPASGPCPFVIQAGFWTYTWWAHELFPACSPPPFTTEGIACVGECPMPCSESINLGRPDSGWRNTFTWTDGRLASASGITTADLTDNEGKPQTRHEQCEYDHGRIARCTADRGPVEVHRDARGRIIEVIEGDNALAVTYDGAGNVIELAGRNGYAHARLRYDDNHRLIAEEELGRDGTTSSTTRYVYDARGRYVHADLGQLENRYDATTGLLVETVGQSFFGDRLVTETVRISYDDHERPVRIRTVREPVGVEHDRAEDYGLIDRDEHEYSYVCPK